MGIGFTDWMKFGVPVVLILMPCGIALLYLVTRPRLSHRVEIQDVTINWTRERKVTLAIFLTTVVPGSAHNPSPTPLAVFRNSTP